jgi:hypothetical protein
MELAGSLLSLHIEDVSGNDLDLFSGVLISNLSWDTGYPD